MMQLSVLHHSLGSDTVNPTTATENFSNTVGELLLEQKLLQPPLDTEDLLCQALAS